MLATRLCSCAGFQMCAIRHSKDQTWSTMYMEAIESKSLIHFNGVWYRPSTVQVKHTQAHRHAGTHTHLYGYNFDCSSFVELLPPVIALKVCHPKANFSTLVTAGYHISSSILKTSTCEVLW